MATTTQSNAVRQLSDGNSQGTSLGQSSTDKISFYNATPIAQQSVVGSVNVTAAVVSSAASTWSFASSQQANAIAAAIFKLTQLGLIS